MSRRAFFLALSAAAIAGAAAVQGDAGAGGPDTDRESARIELGRRLFFDPAIGRQGRIGCASCHDPEHGFSDARVLSQDETGLLPRHSQPLTDLGGEGFHWDGEFDTVREVIDARVLPGRLPIAASMAHTRRRLESATAAGAVDTEAVAKAAETIGSSSEYYASADGTSVVTTIAARLQSGGRYDTGFRAAFGDADVTAARIGDALDAYLATLRTTTSPFDAFLAGDRAALSDAARRGLATFRGKAGCAQCHVAEGPRAALTDGKFHNTGVAARHAKRAFSSSSDPGRAAMSFDGSDRGTFKTPSLRDVARRAPYFHDGSAKTLEDVVRYYAAGGTANDHLDSRLRPFEVTDAELAELVEFLRSLTGSERSGLGAASALRSPRLTVRAERPDGSAAAGVRIVVRPCGDRLAGTTRMPAPVTATTDADGKAVVEMPLATHVTVEAPGVSPGRPLPDWTSSTRIVVTPEDRVSLIVQFPRELLRTPTTVRVWAASRGAEPPLGVEFAIERALVPGTVLFTAGASPQRRGVFSCSVHAEWLWSSGANLSIDFTQGTTNHVELWASPGRESPSESDGTDAIRRDAAAIRDLLVALAKPR